MKKFTATAAMLLVLAMIAVSFYGCIESPYSAKEEVTAEKKETEENEGEESTSPEAESYTEKMDLNSYMRILTCYFHDEYTAGDSLYDRDILTHCLYFAFSNRYKFDFVTVDEKNMTLTVQADKLSVAASALFGTDINLTAWNDYLVIDTYNDGFYTVQYARGGSWGGEPWYTDDFEITETDTDAKVNAEVYYSAGPGEMSGNKSLIYEFDKVVEEGFLYYQLRRITEVK